MAKVMYSGRVALQDGSFKRVILREGKRYWIDNDKNWYLKRNGLKTGVPENASEADQFPRLRIGSIKPLDEKVSRAGSEFHYKGLVQQHVGMPGWRNLRETKGRWVDEYGNRFMKDDGWSTEYDKDKMRLKLNTIIKR